MSSTNPMAPSNTTAAAGTPASADQDATRHRVMSGGLTTEDARRRLEKFGPNAMPDTAGHPLRSALGKFWAPVPWMLEAAIVLQIALGDYAQSAIIGFLLVFNAALGLFEEGKAEATLDALKSRLALTAAVLRDGVWKSLPAREVVPGDTVKLSLGGVVPADVRVIGGEVLLDQSMLTGESIPIEAGPGFQTYSGALVRRGEAVAEVAATGTRTKFGRTAELVRTAHVVSTEQKAVLQVVRNLALFNGVLIVLMVIYAGAHAMPVKEIVVLGLTAVLASIPVALPATFTLAAALGARVLTQQGVLPTRLSAVDEAASMDVLCSDKTGTLTRNELRVTAVRPMPGFDEPHLLAMAALASSDGGQDPVDAAVRAAAASRPASDPAKQTRFVPFDPATKMSEAEGVDSKGVTLRAVTVAFATIIKLTGPSAAASAMAGELEQQGFRVLAVASGVPAAMSLEGLIALSDPPRDDSAELIGELRELGVRTVMVTGDAPATAATVAHAVGLDGPVCSSGPIPAGVKPETFAVFAGVLPEDKYALVKAFQMSGHTVGMCGDGVNDAPALRQAQMGIAVSTATDVAKSAAGIVLTAPGLAGIVASVEEGRISFQRILNYTVYSITKKISQVLFLVAGLLVTGHAILTPMLIVIVMITGDFLSMSLTTDAVKPSPTPNRWRIGNLTIAGVLVGACLLAFCTTAMVVGEFHMGFEIGTLRTLCVVALVFGSQGTIYAVRGRQSLWGPRPSLLLALSSVGSILIISILAAGGVLMEPLPISVLGETFLAAVVFGFVLNAVKIPAFRRFPIA
ncbi:MAG TPA: HAD-IC family P-type ATPase [Blastocatellia bacterium]